MNQYALDLAAQTFTFSGFDLPVDLGRGVVLRYTNDAETDAISNYLGFPDGSRLKTNDHFVCFERIGEYSDESQWPLRTRHAFAMLPTEIFFRSEVPQMRDTDSGLVVGARSQRYRELGARIHESGNFIPTHPVEFTKSTLERVKLLHTFELDSDPFVHSFENAHNSLPNSIFRFVNYMAIVEGLLTPSKEIKNIRNNIASKMAYYYSFIWPTLKLSESLPLPTFKNGKQITDHDGVWNDLYKLRNHTVHGGASLAHGKPLGELIPNKFGPLQHATLGDAANLLDYGLKSLLYWHLERPDQRRCFSEIA